MANPLKVKAGIAAVAIFILILVPLLETKFFAPVTIKRWGTLSWDDFQGIPQLFSSYEAEISSSIYLEYDSVKEQYVAYAGQDNIRSWARRSQEEQEYLLNHEQYHFNITELHARMLNEYIEENPKATLDLYLLRLDFINASLSRMQRKYDEETSHSLIFDKQRHWEYHIDSLLFLQHGWLTDHFSGAHVYLPHPSDSAKGLLDGVPYRIYVQYTYGMQLSVTSYQPLSINYRDITASIKRNIQVRSERLKSFSLDTTKTLRAFAISEDSSNYTYYQLWITDSTYVYQLKTRHPNKTGDTTGYAKIASSFINSFSILNTDSYWISKLEDSKSPIISSSVSKMSEVGEQDDSQYCIRIGNPRPHGFYRGPFYRDDGALFLAYDYLVHPDTLHYKDVMMLNQDWYSHTPTPEGQIYFVPAEKIPQKKYNIYFGYILLQDSVEKCYEFHHQSLSIIPKVSEAR